MSRPLPTPLDLARAVLLFWKPGPWTEQDAAEWESITHCSVVGGATLVEMARQVVEAEVRIDLGPEMAKASEYWANQPFPPIEDLIGPRKPETPK